MTLPPIDPAKVIDAAIELAAESSWEDFSLIELSRRLNCSLVDIKHYFRSKDDMAECLFDRADDAMMQLASQSDFQPRPVAQKLEDLMLCWFESLADIKPLVVEILAYKLEPGHFHLQAHGITRVSRTVQWFLAGADRRKTGIARVADEIAVTSAYLASFSCFLYDRTEGHTKTRKFLKHLLDKIDQGHQLFSPMQGSASAVDRRDSKH